MAADYELDEGQLRQLAVSSVLTDSNLIAVVLDPEMIVRWVSPSAQAFGLAPVGKSVVELVHADDLDRVATTFDMAGNGDEFESTLLTNVVIPVRVITPTRVVPFEATGRWLRAETGAWYFVVALVDVTTRFATTEALRVLASEVDERAAIQVLADSCRSFAGIDGAQVVWFTEAGQRHTLGDLGPDANLVSTLIPPASAQQSQGCPFELVDYDWAHVFPVISGTELLGNFAFWGWGLAPAVRYLAVVVAPLLDLAAVALTRSRAQAALAERANTDPLTGLFNRRAFMDQFPVKHNEWVAVMYIDLDGFKQVNDQWGHSAGDEVLRLVGERLKHVLSRGDTVARIGGDEFAVLCRWIRPESAESVARRVVDTLGHSYDVEGASIPGGASVGLTVGTRRSTGSELLDRADRALLQAKAEGKARLIVASDSEQV